MPMYLIIRQEVIMVIKYDKRQEFGQRLRVALAKTKIRQVDLANRIKCSKQFISNVVNGLSVFTPEQFAEIYDLLSERLNEADLNDLNILFYEAKSNMDFDEIKIKVIKDQNPLLEAVTDELEQLNNQQLRKVQKYILQLKAEAKQESESGTNL